MSESEIEKYEAAVHDYEEGSSDAAHDAVDHNALYELIRVVRVDVVREVLNQHPLEWASASCSCGAPVPAIDLWVDHVIELMKDGSVQPV